MASVELTNSKIDRRTVDSDEAYLRNNEYAGRQLQNSEALADPFLGTFAQERAARRKITRRPVI